MLSAPLSLSLSLSPLLHAALPHYSLTPLRHCSLTLLSHTQLSFISKLLSLFLSWVLLFNFGLIWIYNFADSYAFFGFLQSLVILWFEVSILHTFGLWVMLKW